MKTKTERRKEAEARQVIRDGRTDAEQIQLIAERRGDSNRETLRLMGKLNVEAETEKVVEKPDNMNRAIMSKKMQKRRKRNIKRKGSMQ